MKIKDILVESDEYVDRLESSLFDIITAAKAAGLSTISTKRVTDKLISMGYSVTPDQVVSQLENVPGITSVNEQVITIGNTTDITDKEDDKFSKEVSKLAMQDLK
ncbi:hypothetical protein RVBP17_1480 [Pseudomonas phage sp. 30-3]|nr:hypothetical protein RVBP17_1480 [Pseudomonas phage sp. 30-3]